MTAIADGKSVAAAGLAPLAVHPSMRGRSIGGDLIGAGLERLASLGTQLVFVLGDADYYARFGFSASNAAPFASSYAGLHFMALSLDPSFALPQSGRADYAPAFSALG
jgi:putative acetyltransferase